MASRAAAPKSQRSVFLLAAVVAAAAGTYYSLPGAALALILVVVAVFQDVPPDPATGPPLAKNASPAAVAVADPAFAKRQRMFRRWRMVRTGVMFNTDMLPGWPVALDWLMHVGLALTVASIPVTSPNVTGLGISSWGPALNAVCTFALSTAIFRAKRATELEGDQLPRISLKDLPASASALPSLIGGAIIGSVLAVMAAAVLPGSSVLILVPGLALLIGAGAASMSLSKPVIGPVRELAQQRMQWYSRWLNMKVDPPHRLAERTAYGQDPEAPELIVEVFDTDPRSGGAAAALESKVAKSLDSQVDGGWMATTAEVEALDSSGSPIRHSTDPRRFCVRSWPNTGLPGIYEAAISQELAEQTVITALVNFARDNALSGVRLESLTRISVQSAPEQDLPEPAEAAEAEDAPAPEPAPEVSGSLWQVQITGMDGLTLRTFAPAIAQALGMEEMLVDHRAGLGYIGDFGAQLAPDSPVTAETFDLIMQEATWNKRWEGLMKTGTNPPTPQFNVAAQAHLTGMRKGTEGPLIHSQPFVAREGMSLDEIFFPLAPKLKAALYHSTFSAMLGFPGSSGRPGSRHNLAFNVVWSEEQGVPTRPDDLIPPEERGRTASQAHHWVLAGLLNDAFRAAKLSQPELISAEAMTAGFMPGRPARPGRPTPVGTGPRQRKHIWALHVRLYGADTLKSVREAAEKIRTSWSSAWLRVDSHDEGVMIYVGHTPSEVAFISDKQMAQVDRLDWEQVFLDSKLASVLGVTPKLVSSTLLATNEDVKILTFSSVGSGVTFSSITGSAEKLSANSGYGWIEPVAVPSDPQAFVLRVAAQDPMPISVPHDWDMLAAGPGVAFGVDIEGAAVPFNPKDDPHLLLAGGTGAGKSVTLQSMITSALLQHWPTYVCDVPKGAADFQFATPWLSGVATDTRTALALLRHVYAEVKKRKAVNAAHGVGSYRDLPEEIRPPHMLVLIDEFTSTIIAETVPTPTGDPEADAGRERIKAQNQLLLEMGDLVGRIGREARSAGVSMVLATQSLKADTLAKARMPADMKDNLARAAQGKMTFGQRQATLKDAGDSPNLGEAVPTGRGVLESARGYQVYQSFYHPEEGRHLAQGLAQRLGMPQESVAVDLEEFMPPEIVMRPAVEELTSDPDAPVVTELLKDLDFSAFDFEDETALEPTPETPALPSLPFLPGLPPLMPVGGQSEPVDELAWSVEGEVEPLAVEEQAADPVEEYPELVEGSEWPVENTLSSVDNVERSVDNDDEPVDDERQDPETSDQRPHGTSAQGHLEPAEESEWSVENEDESVDNSDESVDDSDESVDESEVAASGRRSRGTSVEEFVEVRAPRRRASVSLEDFLG